MQLLVAVATTVLFVLWCAWTYVASTDESCNATDLSCTRNPRIWHEHALDEDLNILSSYPPHFLDPSHRLSEIELDALYSSCLLADDDRGRGSSAHLAVVVPFIASQIPLLMESMRRWQRDAAPCRQACRPIDLVLLFHRQLNATARAQLQSVPLSCFRDVTVLNANLPPENDTYGVGTVSMFYGIFHSRRLAQRYDAVFLMEPDVVAVRPYWLDELQRQADRRDFWVRGGLQRAPHFLERGFGPDYSINGNALYRLGSPCFVALLERSRRAQSAGTPFDLALRAMLVDPARFAEQQRILHHIQYAEFIRNMGDGHTWTELEDVRRNAPATFLVHTKMWNDDRRE
jgi:hypothetical protein